MNYGSSVIFGVLFNCQYLGFFNILQFFLFYFFVKIQLEFNQHLLKVKFKLDFKLSLINLIKQQFDTPHLYFIVCVFLSVQLFYLTFNCYLFQAGSHSLFSINIVVICSVFIVYNSQNSLCVSFIVPVQIEFIVIQLYNIFKFTIRNFLSQTAYLQQNASKNRQAQKILVCSQEYHQVLYKSATKYYPVSSASYICDICVHVMHVMYVIYVCM
eukprot:TRINITY_DN7767_c1_g2_i1.p3 TRINITY_DN7767_c1_g2~~TRINITY_DN7767_c1_g2_i1.p3  ORF type:complete len:213 (+),score=-16.23 TRINITY_DN7767_c1_g2_i1:143-781(+)